MAIKKILTVPHPVLREKSKPVDKIDKKTKTLIKDLKDTLETSSEPKGVGLSAPQIGVLKKVFIIKDKEKTRAFINPKILSSSKKTLSQTLPEDKQPLEGCLSIPGIWGFVNRPAKIKLSFLDKTGQEKKESFKGKKAICIQHEIDHLNGILFIDRVLAQKGKLYRVEKDKEGKNVLVELGRGNWKLGN